ncbi:dTDP-glucose 4,6-dehydratase [soil metagenome]
MSLTRAAMTIPRKLVITGALGHIGSRLIRALPDGYDEVVLIDDLSTQRYCSLFDLPGDVPFHFVEGDVCSLDLAPLFAGAESIVHLAALTDAAASYAERDRVTQVNVAGTERVARACASAGAALVFPSTTSIYSTTEPWVDESCSDESLRPQSPYAASKLEAERVLARLAGGGGLRHVTLRFGTIVGASAGMRFHTAANRFAWQACAGQPLSVWRTALHQLRPYLDLGDAIRAIRFVLDSRLADGATYNVVSENTTVARIVDVIRTFVPDLQVAFVNAAAMNELSFEVRDERIRALGFDARTPVSTGIAETVRMLRSMRQKWGRTGAES